MARRFATAPSPSTLSSFSRSSRSSREDPMAAIDWDETVRDKKRVWWRLPVATAIGTWEKDETRSKVRLRALVRLVLHVLLSD